MRIWLAGSACAAISPSAAHCIAVSSGADKIVPCRRERESSLCTDPALTPIDSALLPSCTSLTKKGADGVAA